MYHEAGWDGRDREMDMYDTDDATISRRAKRDPSTPRDISLVLVACRVHELNACSSCACDRHFASRGTQRAGRTRI